LSKFSIQILYYKVIYQHHHSYNPVVQISWIDSQSKVVQRGHWNSENDGDSLRWHKYHHRPSRTNQLDPGNDRKRIQMLLYSFLPNTSVLLWRLARSCPGLSLKTRHLLHTVVNCLFLRLNDHLPFLPLMNSRILQRFPHVLFTWIARDRCVSGPVIIQQSIRIPAEVSSVVLFITGNAEWLRKDFLPLLLVPIVLFEGSFRSPRVIGSSMGSSLEIESGISGCM